MEGLCALLWRELGRGFWEDCAFWGGPASCSSVRALVQQSVFYALIRECGV